MTPRGLLTTAGLSVGRITSALPGFDLDAVSLREAPGWLIRVWTRDTRAMALPKVVYLSPELFAAQPSSLGPLLVHELVHVAQWAELGILGFLWRYVREYVSGRLKGLAHSAAYRAISLEVSAREITASLT